MTTTVTTDGEHGVEQLRSIVATDVLGLMAEEVYECNVEKGWYSTSRTFGDEIALLHSEVSEMLEAWRINGNCEDQTGIPHAANGDNPKPEGVGSEAGDVLVRLLDTCRRNDIDLFKEWRRKMDYNWTRPTRHGNKAL